MHIFHLQQDDIGRLIKMSNKFCKFTCICLMLNLQ